MSELLQNISNIIGENLWLAPLAALFAGILNSFMPCNVSTLPLIIAYVGGSSQENPKKAFRLSLVYILGTSITHTVLGITASLFGSFIGQGGKWWYIILGVLMVFMALQTWEIFNFIPSTYLQSKSKMTGYIGALIAGILGGIFSTPCSTPVLVALLAVVAGKGNVLWGILLLLLYSAGNGTLALISGTSVGFIKKLTQSEKFGKAGAVLKIVLGTVILLIAFYLFYLAF
ncbi:MAG TPA: cytochrome c biogenesis CcdA family protein [Clostridia bacterium]|nr:cytochrome c biogenesis CcdA family protein [Clostridia bacterium]